MDGDDCVGSGRQSLDREMSIGIGNSEERIGRHIDERLHPRMIVAAHRNHNLWRWQRTHVGRSIRRLRNIDSLIGTDLWREMNVVHRWIAVRELDGLSGLYTHHMRSKPAALLIDHDRV